MSLNRIYGVWLQEIFITKRSFEVMFDLPFFSVMTIVVFGFFSTYLTGSSNSLQAKYLLLGMIFWEIIRVNQYSISVSALWNVWSRNLSNMFIAPLTGTEYIVASILSSIVKSSVILILISTIAYFAFGFNILSIGLLNLSLHFLNLTLFAWSTGLIILGVIFKFGTRIQALAWGLIFLFQPLTAAFFPVSVLPHPLQTIAWMLPATYAFEAGRYNLVNPQTRWDLILPALGGNLVFFILSIGIFQFLFRRSRVTGQFARNEG